MATKVGAIETHYKGYRFRSRLEARWAVFLDVLGIRWEYEKEGFDLKGLRYLPDFWLPDLKMWLEIKPEAGTPISYRDAAMTKADRLVDLQGWPVCIFFGMPDLGSGGVGIRNDVKDSGSAGRGYDDPIFWMRCRSCGQLSVSIGDDDHEVVDDDWMPWRRLPCCEIEKNRDGHDPVLRRAVDAARGARFEFGESGARR